MRVMDATPLFDAPEMVEAARQDGMDRAAAHAPDDWKGDAIRAINAVAIRGAAFTADHVWLELERRGVPPPPTPAALGPIFVEAAKDGLIRKTGRLVRTQFARRHRDLVEWVKR
jgi:hypothetical protein